MALLTLKLFNFRCLHLKPVALHPQVCVSAKSNRGARMVTQISSLMEMMHLLPGSAVSQMFELLSIRCYILLFHPAYRSLKLMNFCRGYYSQ